MTEVLNHNLGLALAPAQTTMAELPVSPVLISPDLEPDVKVDIEAKEEPVSEQRLLTQLEFNWDIATPIVQNPDLQNPDLEVPPRQLTQSPDLELPKSGNAASVSAGQDQSQRILQLEQALGQCQLYIDELKNQLEDQEFLEDVLAKTEEAAHVQQQAINCLKQQLTQQEIVAGQITELERVKFTLESALQDAELTALADKAALSKLQSLLQQEQDARLATQTSFDQRLSDLELQVGQKDHELSRLRTQLAQAEELTQKRTDQLATLKSRAQRLEGELQENRQLTFETESHLQRTKEIVVAQQELLHTLEQMGNSDGSKNKVLQNMSKTLLQSQNKIEALESALTNQRLAHAKLQHHSTELEEEAGTHQKRVSQLERQVAEMQEQILHQAQQASEFETAVQHWKDRGGSAEQSLAQLKLVLEHLVTDRQLAELELVLSGNGSDPTTLGTESERLLRGLKLTLPSFFSLRRDNIKA